MNSLSELNGFGATSLTVADDRPSKVIFDRVSPLGPVDQILTVSSTTVNVNEGINIVEVINYSTANVRYQIVIRTSGSPLLTGSTITWPSLPSGVVLTVVGSTYVLSGINTPALWEQIKDFTWNLPAGYTSSPQWYLDISIIYYDSALGQDVSVDYVAYDPIYYKVSEMEVTSSLTCIGQDARLVSASLICSTVLFFEPKLLEGIIDTVVGNFSITCNARLKPKDDLQSQFILTGSGVRSKFGTATLNPTFFVSCNLSALVTNIISRTFNGQSENLIFASETPFIDDADPNTTATFTVTLTSDGLGVWSTSYYSIEWPTSTYTITGTKSQVNNKLAQVRFFPQKNISRSGTYTLSISKNGTNLINLTAPLIFNPASYTTQLVTITETNTAWFTPTYMSIYATTIDMLMVGGGGSGYGTNGGGGGGVFEAFNIPLSYNFPYNLQIGQGGKIIGLESNGTRTYVANGNITQYEATGGQAGAGSYPPQRAGNSGRNGNGGPFNVGGFSVARGQGGWMGFSSVASSGGGGGGAGGSGQNATELTFLGASTNPSYGGNGGQGVLSTITGLYYGGGGGGGSDSVNIISQGGVGGGGRGACNAWYNTSGQLQTIAQQQFVVPPDNNTVTRFGPFGFNSTPGVNSLGGGGGGAVGGAFQTNVDPIRFAPGRYGSDGGSGVIVFRFNA